MVGRTDQFQRVKFDKTKQHGTFKPVRSSQVLGRCANMNKYI